MPRTHPSRMGQQGEDALLEIFKQVGHGADDLVVEAEGEGHGAPGDSGDHVGDSDHHAFYDVE